MSPFATVSYDDLQVMVNTAVRVGLHDHANGREHVPMELLQKLEGLAEDFTYTLKAHRENKALEKELREQRNEVSSRLARHVRNVHFMFHRLFSMGDVNREDMSEFGIPEESLREAAYRIKVWSHQAGMIIRGYYHRQERGGDPLPAYLMSVPIIELLKEHKEIADRVAGSLHSQISVTSKRHQHLQSLRGQIVHLLALMRKHLELSLFEHPAPDRNQIMKAYGVPVAGKRGRKPKAGKATSKKGEDQTSEASEEPDGEEPVEPPLEEA